jgi:deazaflavin-dependent oxidoreductase (nitroreductase family)
VGRWSGDERDRPTLFGGQRPEPLQAGDGRRYAARMPDRRLPRGAKLLFRIHRVAYGATGGLVGHWLTPTVRCLLLTTTGAKSGLERVSPLVYGRDGANLVLVASQGGTPKNPPWYHNLKAHPAVGVQVGRSHLTMRAREVTDAAERQRLWDLMVRNYDGYEGYRKATTRLIPVIVLEPISAAAPSAA